MMSSFSSWSSRSNEIKWFWSFLGSQLRVWFILLCAHEAVPTYDTYIDCYAIQCTLLLGSERGGVQGVRRVLDDHSQGDYTKAAAW